MPKLLDQARDTIRLRHYSIRTEESYIGWMKRYILFHNKRHPAQMGEPEVTAFLSHLAVDRKVSSSTQNQALAALLFLYKEVLQPLDWLDNIQRAKKPERLPLVFTREEVRSILMQLEGSKWIVGSLLYGAGLRLLDASASASRTSTSATIKSLCETAKAQRNRGGQGVRSPIYAL